MGPGPAQCGFIRDSVTQALPQQNPQAGVWGVQTQGFALGFCGPREGREGRHDDTPPSISVCVASGLRKPALTGLTFLTALISFQPRFLLPAPPPHFRSHRTILIGSMCILIGSVCIL